MGNEMNRRADRHAGPAAIFALAALAFAAGVGATQETGTAAAQPLTDTAWRLVEFQSMDDATGTLRPDDPTVYTLRFFGDGSASLGLACNRAHGPWTAEASGDGSSGSFQLGPLTVTRARCGKGDLGERLARDAGYIRSYVLRDGRLFLTLMADAGIWAWEPDDGSLPAGVVPSSPEEGGPRDWEVAGVDGVLNLREEPSTSASILTGFAAGTILDNLGCRRAAERIWCDVQPLGGGPRGFVAVEYLKPAVSPDGTVARGPDDSALRAGRRDFDATGDLPCVVAADTEAVRCEFGVARAGGGYATLVVRKPDGRERVVTFRMGRAIGFMSSQAEGYPAFAAEREGDRQRIRIGDERYEVADVVVLGD